MEQVKQFTHNKVKTKAAEYAALINEVNSKFSKTKVAQRHEAFIKLFPEKV